VVYEDYLKAKQLFVKRGRENLDEALALVNDATNRDPSYAPAWTLKAMILGVYNGYVDDEEARKSTSKWYAEAKHAAEKALALDPNSAEAYATFAKGYFNSFNFIKAFENYNRAIELAPDNPIILDTMAQSALDVGYFEKAKNLSEKAVAIDPLVAMYRNNLGRANVFLGFDAKAIKNFEKSIALDPSLPVGYNNLSAYYFTPETSEQFIEIEARRLPQGFDNSDYDQIFLQTITLLQDNQALEDTNAVLSLREQTDDKLVKFFLSVYLRDTDSIIKLQEYFWSQQPRLSLDHYPFNITVGLYSSVRWKQQVRQDGVLALWQTNGFPAHCKPIGKDDFECDYPKRSQ
jgi:tetratricopeptide (TPR) repeat protein